MAESFNISKKEVKVIRPTINNEFKEHKTRVAAYCRVSTDSDDQICSFLAQVKYYNDFIKNAEELELMDIYADEGITGTCINKRDEFKRMMKDASLGKIDRVLTKSVSRFARNSLECLEAIRELAGYGVSVLFENDNIDTKTMNSEMILYVKSAFAQSEALAGSKRVSVAIRMKMENGSFSTYHAPYGYVLENHELVIVPEQAEVVRRIFVMYLDGNGINRIAAALNRDGIIFNGTAWNNTRVRYILSNEKYIGDSLLQKTYTPQMLPLRNRPNRGELDKYYVNDTHQAIISKEDFSSVQVRLNQRENRKEQSEEKKYILSGMIVCSECGWRYRRKEQNNKVYWVCSHKGNAGFQCGGKNILESDIYDAFTRMYNKLRQYEKEVLDITLSQLIELRTKITSGNSAITQIDSVIAKLCEQNNMYVKLRAKEIMDEISYMEQTAVLKKRLTELRSRRSKLLSENEDESTIEGLRILKETLSEYPSAIISFDQIIFYAIVDKMLAGNDGMVTFILKGGLKLKEKIMGV